MRTPDEIDVYADDLTTAEAAQLAGVTPDAVRQWKARGHLQPASYDEKGWPRYRAIDVHKAEAATREHAHRA